MFQPAQLGSGQRVWKSSLLGGLGVPHLFTTNNWDVKSPDEVADVIGAARWFGDAPLRIVMAKQVHGNTVSSPNARAAAADAHFTQDPREVVVVGSKVKDVVRNAGPRLFERLQHLVRLALQRDLHEHRCRHAKFTRVK